MSNIYRVTKEELNLLCIIMEINKLPGTSEIINLSEDRWKSVLDLLIEKNYIINIENKSLELSKTLKNILRVMESSHKCFVIEEYTGDEVRIKHIAYFYYDAIVTYTYKNGLYELTWLPVLQLEIGQIIRIFTQWSNENTEYIDGYSINELDSVRDNYVQEGYTNQWTIKVNGFERGNVLIEVYSNGKQQLIVIADGNTEVICPNRVDFVNTLIKYLGRLHAEAIERGGRE